MPKRSRKLRVFFLCAFIGLILVGIWVIASNPLLTCQQSRLAPIPVSCDRLQQDVEFLTSIQPPRHSENLASLNKAADYIAGQWRALGFDVQEQKYVITGKEYKNLLVSFGPENGERIIVGAHYDVCGDQPGADDNASGVAGLLELSRLLKELRPSLKNRVDLVAYTLEEPPYYDTPYMGSLMHAKLLAAQKIPVKFMLSLEMIGYFSDLKDSQQFPFFFLKWIYPRVGNFVAIIGNLKTWKLVRELKEKFRDSSALRVYSMNSPSIVEGIDYSDHRSFWQLGFPAAMVTDTAFFRNVNYHLPSDTIETLDFQRMAEVVRGVFGMITLEK